MTINEYLWRLEWLRIDKERKFERYLRLHEQTVSPRSSLDIDGLPHRSQTNTRELQLIRSASALEKYYDADERFEIYRDEVLNNLSKLEHRYRITLEHVYVWSLDKAPEQRKNGLCRALCLRRKNEIPPIMREAKAALREVLIGQGIEVE